MGRLLATTALITTLSAAPAVAEPVTLAIAATAAATGLSVATVSFLAQVALSLALTAASALLTKVPSQPQIKNELRQETSRPAYRTAYGRDRVPGTPAPWRVKGNFLYGCLILNSRPSAGNVQVFFDKRLATVTEGDLLDFSGDGALCVIDDAPTQGELGPRLWLGRGDQTAPPAYILADAPDLFLPTDAWRGRTVLWMRLEVGRSTLRQRRWPSTPPLVEVVGDWSRVWDPRDAAQDPDNETTWQFSRNQALCLLDALRTNPVRRYRLQDLHLPSFIDGANIADQFVPRRFAASAERRYSADGVIQWAGAEIVDQVQPLVAAGGGRLVRVGSQLGYASGAYRGPIYTAQDLLEDEDVVYEAQRSGRDLPRAIKGAYTAPARDWQVAETPPVAVPGGGTTPGDDGVRELPLSFVTSPTQAQRLVKIEALRTGGRKTLKCMLPPDSADIVDGATIAVDLPPAWARINGVYEVQSCHPGLFFGDDGGVALRNPVTLVRTGPEIYAWDPDTEETEPAGEDFDATQVPLVAPTEILFQTGAAVAIGQTARVRFAFNPVEVADYYEWQFFVAPDGWSDTRRVSGEDLDDDGRVFGFVSPVTVGLAYGVRARAVVRRGSGVQVSAWRSDNVIALAPDFDLDPPLNGVATGGAGQIVVEFTSPNSADFQGLEIFTATVNDADAGTLLGERLWGPQNMTFTVEHTDLGAAETRFYFARSIGPSGVTSAFAPSVTATTDP